MSPTVSAVYLRCSGAEARHRQTRRRSHTTKEVPSCRPPRRRSRNSADGPGSEVRAAARVGYATPPAGQRSTAICSHPRARAQAHRPAPRSSRSGDDEQQPNSGASRAASRQVRHAAEAEGGQIFSRASSRRTWSGDRGARSRGDSQAPPSTSGARSRSPEDHAPRGPTAWVMCSPLELDPGLGPSSGASSRPDGSHSDAARGNGQPTRRASRGTGQ